MNFKNITKIASFIAVFCTMLLVSNRSMAQASCPYVITNNLSCPIKLQYTVFSNSCNNYWFTNQIAINPNSSYTVPCSDFGGCKADIEINLLTVDNIYFVCNPPYSNSVSSVKTNADASGLFPGASCSPIGIFWTSTGCTIQ